MDWINFFKAFILGVVEGITEWLPISSTGHLILVDTFINLHASVQFKEIFNVVIQLGAVLAVIKIFYRKLNPFSVSTDLQKRKKVLKLWKTIFVACIPVTIAGLLLDDWFTEHFHAYFPISFMLIIYGILFIIIENWNKKRIPDYTRLTQLNYKEP